MKLFKRYTIKDIPEGYTIFGNDLGHYQVNDPTCAAIINPKIYQPWFFNNLHDAVKACIKHYEKINKDKEHLKRFNNWKPVK